jgi:hypothetical protein
MTAGGITEDDVVYDDSGDLVATRDLIKMLKAMHVFGSENVRITNSAAIQVAAHGDVDFEAMLDCCAETAMAAARHDTIIDGGDIIYPTQDALKRVAATWAAGGFMPPDRGEGSVVAFQLLSRVDGEVIIPPTVALVSIEDKKTHVAALGAFIDDGGYKLVLSAYFIARLDEPDAVLFEMAPVAGPPFTDQYIQNIFLSVLTALDAAAARNLVGRAQH